MPDVDPTHYRLNDLKLRWEQDPSSRLFLQLADEHRKLGQHSEAVTVLEQGLEHRPNDLSALVALGRCRLDLELAGEAVEPLETVVSRDPTHIVASKLLIEAHLQQGDVGKATERLRVYKLLNDRDPEMAHLEYRLKRLEDEDEQESPTVATAELTDEIEATSEPESASESSVSEPDTEAPEPELELEASESSDEVPAESVTEVTPSVLSADPPSEPEPEFSSPPAAETPEPLAEEPAAAQSASERAVGVDPFELSTDIPPSPDLDALWKQLPEPEPPPADPFLGLTALDAGRHWEMLAQEGIFSSPGAPAGNGGDPVTSSVVELEKKPATLLSVPEAAKPEDQPEEPKTDVDSEIEAESAEPAEQVSESGQIDAEAVEVEPEVQTSPSEAVVELEELEATAGDTEAAEDTAAEDTTAEEMAAEDAVTNEPTELEAAAEPEPAEIEVEAETAVSEAELAEPAEPTSSQELESETEGSPLIGALAAGAVAGAAAIAGLSESRKSGGEPEVDDTAPVPVAVEAEELAVEATPAIVDSSIEDPPESDDTAPVQTEPESAEEAATATLGELYLKQGHRDEAERIFRQVLEQDPGNRAALAGLAQLDPLRARPLTAADLLAVRTAGGRIPEGLTAKKVLVLGNYSKQLRAGAERLGDGEISPR